MNVSFDVKKKRTKIELLKRERDLFPTMFSLLDGIARNTNSQHAMKAAEHLQATLNELKDEQSPAAPPY